MLLVNTVHAGMACCIDWNSADAVSVTVDMPCHEVSTASTSIEDLDQSAQLQCDCQECSQAANVLANTIWIQQILISAITMDAEHLMSPDATLLYTPPK